MANEVPNGEALRARAPQMFPVLDDAQIARIARFGKELTLPAGTLLFDEGDRLVPMYVVLEGAIEVVHPRGAFEDLVTSHGPKQFTGEMTMLSDRRALVRGRTTQPTRSASRRPSCARSCRWIPSSASSSCARSSSDAWPSSPSSSATPS